MRGNDVSLRPACADDVAVVFEWRNDPFIVRKGSQQRTVTWTEHCAWFATQLTNPSSRIYLIHVGREPAGQVRFHMEGTSEAEVSLYLLERFTGHGHGVVALQTACWQLFGETQIERVSAFVRADNEPSARAFLKAGFSVAEPDASARQDHIKLRMSRPATVPHNRLTWGAEEAQAAAEAVGSGRWSAGPRVHALETAIAARVGARHAVAVASGLGALRLTLLGVGVRGGDRVLVPAYSCVAVANAVLACGAMPIPVDVQSADWNVDPRDAFLAGNGLAPSAIVAINTFGAPADTLAMQGLGIPVIEDCAHGYSRIDQGVRGAAAIFSFHATKLMGAGEGGMIVTDSDELAARLRDLRDYSDKPPDGTRLNEQMSDIEAAVALCQLHRLSDMLVARERIASVYDAHLTTPEHDTNRYRVPELSSKRMWYRYPVELLQNRAAEMIAHMNRDGICAAEPVTDWRPSGLRHCPVADRAYQYVISLPLYPTLTDTEQKRVLYSFLRFWT